MQLHTNVAYEMVMPESSRACAGPLQQASPRKDDSEYDDILPMPPEYAEILPATPKNKLAAPEYAEILPLKHKKIALLHEPCYEEL